MMMELALLTIGTMVICWLTVRANCPGCRRLICLAVCDEVARNMEAPMQDEICGYVRTAADAEAFISAVQGMHDEPLLYRPAVLPNGMQVMEIYKAVRG